MPGDLAVQLPLIFLASFGVQFLVIALSHRYQIFIDTHLSEKPQRSHHAPTPRAGGIGIFVASLSLLFSPPGWHLALPLIFAFLSGIGEDINYSISPKMRLLLQFGAALCAVFLVDTVVTYIGLGISLPYTVAIAFSAFAMVGAMNAVNIIDGVNGLAAGTTLLILTAFSLVAYQVGDEGVLIINLYVIAATLGFFVFNFPFGKIFMGDGGAYMLGFIVAASGIILAGHHDGVSPWFILTVLIYPVWEVLFSILRRGLHPERSPLYPDRDHLHQLVNRQITRNNPLTALFILLLNAPFVLLPALFYANNSKANMATALLFITLYTLLYRRLLRQDRQADSVTA